MGVGICRSRENLGHWAGTGKFWHRVLETEGLPEEPRLTEMGLEATPPMAQHGGFGEECLLTATESLPLDFSLKESQDYSKTFLQMLLPGVKMFSFLFQDKC